MLTNELLKKEFLEKEISDAANITWISSLDDLVNETADVYMDLLFDPQPERIERLANLEKPVFINAVIETLAELRQPFIRINAWPGFLKRRIIELASNKEQEKIAASVFSSLQWQYMIVPDEPGMIAARVISMIVNEAFYALGDGVSTREEIDIAMKLGTNYPYGPFEWSEQIGLKNIHALLLKLCERDKRYVISRAMINEINKGEG